MFHSFIPAPGLLLSCAPAAREFMGFFLSTLAQDFTFLWAFLYDSLASVKAASLPPSTLMTEFYLSSILKILQGIICHPWLVPLLFVSCCLCLTFHYFFKICCYLSSKVSASRNCRGLNLSLCSSSSFSLIPASFSL